MTRLVVLLCMAAGTLLCEAEDNRASRRSDFTPASPSHFLTNAVQFRELSANDYLNECAFHLTGVVTLVDSNRSLVVLQDATGAVAVNFDLPGDSLRAGQLVSLEGTNCYPYVRDNGCGFDAGAVGSSQSADLRYGLSGIIERVRILGGTLAVESQLAQGTSLMVEIPKPVSHA